MNASTSRVATAILVHGSPAQIFLLIDLEASAQALTGPPVAVHARRDDGAARPVFLHIGRSTTAHRIWARIVTRIDIGFPLVLPVDRHAPERPPALCGRVGGGLLRRLRGTYP